MKHTPYQHRKADLAEALGALFFITAAALFGFTGGLAVAELREPDCPTEDSCVVDYHDHEWHIKEVTP